MITYMIKSYILRSTGGRAASADTPQPFSPDIQLKETTTNTIRNPASASLSMFHQLLVICKVNDMTYANIYLRLQLHAMSRVA